MFDMSSGSGHAAWVYDQLCRRLVVEACPEACEEGS